MSNREIAYGTFTRHLTSPDLYEADGRPIPAVPAHEERLVENIDTEFAKAYRATKTVGKADEKVKMAQSLEWLENCDDGTVIRFTKTFPGSSSKDGGWGVDDTHVLTFAAIRWGDHWFVTFESNKQSRMTTMSLIIWLLSGFPVTEIEAAIEWRRWSVTTSTKIIDEEKAEEPKIQDNGAGCPVCDKHFETTQIRLQGWKIPLHIKLGEKTGTCAGSGQVV
jgi:hypothetical protein